MSMSRSSSGKIIPSVAVVIAAYNAAETVGAAVESALAQAEATEVWVVDDASTDETSQIARGCDDGSGRLRVITLAVNGGPSVARNVALDGTGADWICVLDADDRFAAGRLGRLLAASDQVEMVADAITRVVSTATDPEALEAGWAGSDARWTMIPLDDFIRGNVSRRGQYREELGFIKPLMSMAFLRRHNIRYSDSLRLGEDFLLYAQILAHGGRLRLGPACGYLALTRADSLSGRHSINDLERLRDCTALLAHIRPLTAAERVAVRRHWRSLDDRLQWRRLIEAVKDRDTGAALQTFHDPKSALHLSFKLVEQAWVRALRRVGGLPRPQGPQ